MGQDAGLIHDIPPAAEIVRRIAQEAEEILARTAAEACSRPSGGQMLGRSCLRNTTKCESEKLTRKLTPMASSLAAQHRHEIGRDHTVVVLATRPATATARSCRRPRRSSRPDSCAKVVNEFIT